MMMIQITHGNKTKNNGTRVRKETRAMLRIPSVLMSAGSAKITFCSLTRFKRDLRHAGSRKLEKRKDQEGDNSQQLELVIVLVLVLVLVLISA